MSDARGHMVDEPLLESAPLAIQWAPHMCAVDHNGQRCDAYHGFWQVLRLLGLGATLGGHASHYLRAITEAMLLWQKQAAHGPLRILIAGCADYSMLAHVLQAVRTTSTPADISVLDRCPTPLRLCEWYAQRLGHPVRTVCADLLQHQVDVGHDLIVTSSLLGYFHPAIRPDLFRCLAAMLRPAGRLVLSNRLRSGQQHLTVGLDHAQALDFATRVAQACSQLPGQLLAGSDAHAMALAYVALRRPYPLDAVESIAGLAAAASLAIMESYRVRTPARSQQIQGPTLDDGSEYVFVVLQKPDLPGDRPA